MVNRSQALARIEQQIEEADAIEAENPEIVEGELEPEEAPIAGVATVTDVTPEAKPAQQTPSSLATLRNTLLGTALLSQAAQGLKGFGYDAGSQIRQLPIPGGIGVPLSILLFLWLVFIPYNGHTRLRWLWLSITGNAHIDVSKAVDINVMTNTPDLSGIQNLTGNAGPGFNTTDFHQVQGNATGAIVEPPQPLPNYAHMLYITSGV